MPFAAWNTSLSSVQAERHVTLASGTDSAISAHFASARCRYQQGLSPIGKGRPYLLVRGREPVGKKIDFLLQEVQRELNTISSKMPQIEVVNRVVAGKEQVEKVREQVQNVE